MFWFLKCPKGDRQSLVMCLFHKGIKSFVGRHALSGTKSRVSSGEKWNLPTKDLDWVTKNIHVHLPVIASSKVRVSGSQTFTYQGSNISFAKHQSLILHWKLENQNSIVIGTPNLQLFLTFPRKEIPKIKSSLVHQNSNISWFF